MRKHCLPALWLCAVCAIALTSTPLPPLNPSGRRFVAGRAYFAQKWGTPNCTSDDRGLPVALVPQPLFDDVPPSPLLKAPGIQLRAPIEAGGGSRR